MAKRIRKPGGGRKPSGPIADKRATFSTRITEETRGALEAAANLAGISLSQLVELLLKKGLEDRRRREADPPIRAFGMALAILADSCAQFDEEATKCEWHSNPFVFESFRIAIGLFLERLRPDGETVHPERDLAMPGATSPEGVAQQAFARMWNGLVTNTRASPSEIEREWLESPPMREPARRRELPQFYYDAMAQSSQVFSDIARDLNITQQAREQKK